MTSTRLILIFLGFIFLIIVILTSSKISSALRQRFAAFVPSMKLANIQGGTPTPTGFFEMTLTLTPTPTTVIRSPGTKTSNSVQNTTKGGLASREIPATGPEDLVWLTLGGSLTAGVFLKKISTRFTG